MFIKKKRNKFKESRNGKNGVKGNKKFEIST